MEEISQEAMLELVAGCDERADALQAELELLETELAAHRSQEEARWADYEANNGEPQRTRWVLFRTRMDLCRRSAHQTGKDIAHYRLCSAALKARAGEGSV